MILIYFIWGIFFTTIITAIVVCVRRIKKHKNTFTNYKRIIESKINAESVKEFFGILNERSFDYIRNYFIFQGVAMCTNGLAFLFTVASLILTVSPAFTTDLFTYQEWGTIISIMSIIFVVVNIYINPTKRGTQYLERWRETDKNIIKFISQLEKYGTTAENDFNRLELEKIVEECANGLIDGEFKITSDEE